MHVPPDTHGGTTHEGLTLPDVPTEGSFSSPDIIWSPALCLAWSNEEPHLVGSLLLPPPGSPSKRCIFGRGKEASTTELRVHLCQARPGKVSRGTPLRCKRISRNQLAMRSLGPDVVELENRGLCEMRVNGVTQTKVEARPGDIVEFGSQLMFYVVCRPYLLPAFEYAAFDFGAPDSSGIVGESAAVWDLRSRISYVAPRDGHVLLRGPSGSGKELAATGIHRASPRGRRKLIARNAATIPEGLMAAELFGNLKNYPNPGMAARPGLIGEAADSSLFLDELAELPEAQQAQLLRVLDAGEYQRLGETQVRSANFRLIAATNRPESALKQDVLARFLFRVELPGLNERREDIPLLVNHLLRMMAKQDPAIAERFFVKGDGVSYPRLSANLVRALLGYDYRTNIRELHTMLWRAAERSQGDKLNLPKEDTGRMQTPRAGGSVPPPPGSIPPPQTAPGASLVRRRTPRGGGAAYSPAELQAALDRNNGVIEDTWRELGLSSRHVLARLVRKHGLQTRRNR